MEPVTFQKRTKIKLGIVTIAFNNDAMIQLQIHLFKNYLEDDFELICADNSDNDQIMERIRKACAETKTAYIRLPQYRLENKNGSLSHGMAMNWTLKNICRKKEYEFFGFVDHDVFPIRKTRILNQLQQRPLYGLIHERGQLWYLWAGFCFFASHYVKNKEMNFLPVKGVDTGGGNWSTIYRHIPRKQMAEMPYSCSNIDDLVNLKREYWQTKKIPEEKYEQVNPDLLEKDKFIEFFGDWVHTFNASNWRKGESKNQKVLRLFQKGGLY